MSAKDPEWLAQYLNNKKHVLLMAGALCDQIVFGDKNLLDYAAEIARSTGATVAATGNTVRGFRERGIDIQKAWFAGVVSYTHYDQWPVMISENRPKVMVLLGYSPALSQKMACGVKGMETVSLGNVYVDQATYSLPDASLRKWEEELATLVRSCPVRTP